MTHSCRRSRVTIIMCISCLKLLFSWRLQRSAVIIFLLSVCLWRTCIVIKLRNIASRRFLCGYWWQGCIFQILTKHSKTEQSLYNALHGIQITLKLAQVWITQFNLQGTSYLPLPRKRSPDGAFTDWGGEHLIAAHYSFIDRERMSWPGLEPHKWSPISWRSSVRQGKFAGQDWRSTVSLVYRCPSYIGR